MMLEKSTDELENILKNTKLWQFDNYRKENKNDIINETNDFTAYMKLMFCEKKMSQTQVFAKAGIPQGYGYKLLSMEKKTRQRDVILRICYAANFTIEQTQRALKKYGMPQLYAKVDRDAYIMIMFNERPGDLDKVNELLIAENMEELRRCGEYGE